MFVEPDANEIHTAIKVDPSAPARSAIRRQRTVRYTTHVRDRPSSRAHRDAVSRDFHQRRLMQEFMRYRGRDPERLVLEAEQEAARAEAERAEASRQQRLSNGRALLRDGLSYERPSQRIRILRDYDDLPDLIPMVDPERTSYSEVLRRSTDHDATRDETHASSRSPPPRYMPTPPYSFEESSNRSSPDGFTAPPNAANYSSRFAPADRLANESMDNYTTRMSRRSTHQAMLDEITRPRVEVERTREEARRTREEISRAWRETDPSAYDTLGELRRLRRMGHRHRTPPGIETRLSPPRNRSNVDGLGDRRRSFSPEDDAWDTLLTTITPDERVPSVHSSFTSATASASVSVAPNPASSSSYGTLATLPSSSASAAGFYPNLCDNTDSEDSLTEDESTGMTIHGISAGNTSYSMTSAPPSRGPVYSRRYDTRFTDREEQLQQVDAEIDALRSSAANNVSLSQRIPDMDRTYEDSYRRERLRHLRATEMGSERSSGVRPARERL